MKRLVSLLLAVCLFVLPLFGCGKAPAGANETSSDEISEPPESPAEDFEYEENEDGGITITKYVGEDLHVVIPEKIDGKNVTRLGNRSFNVPFIVTLKIPDTVTVIESYAFQLSPYLMTVDLSQNLKAIKENAFEECFSLSTISLPESLTEIGDYAFQDCTALKQITIPKNVTTWGACTFENSGLETVEFEEGLEIIGDNAFSSTNLQEVYLPKSMKTIQTAAFSSCDNLTSLILNEGLLTIGSLILLNTNVKEIAIPTSVKTVQETAFLHCDSLEKVKFEGDAPQDFSVPPSPYTDVDGEVHTSEYQGDFTVCYHEGAQGFTSPTWEGYNTEIW